MTLFIHVLVSALFAQPALAVDVGFTMDDPEVYDSVLFSGVERNQKILDAFAAHGIKAALFTCGMRIDSHAGRNLLALWDKAGHLIASHSYSHMNYNSRKVSYETYRDDFLRVEPLLSGYRGFKKLYRFPMLKEGNTAGKRDRMRAFLKERGYEQGYVTIDASDWYIDNRLIARIRSNPRADLKPYRDFYLQHMWSRTQYYRELAKKVYGREIKHTVLVHHNVLNALFLGDLIEMYKRKGWNIISAEEAFEDGVFSHAPNIVPAGESIVWADAKESGRFEQVLRYPGEDGEYEREAMDRLGL